MSMTFATNLMPSGTQDLGSSTSKWDDLYVTKINGKNTEEYDDVLEYIDYDAFPLSGTAGIIYVDKTTNSIYRWNGESYVAIGGNSSAITDSQIDALFT